MAGEAAGYGSGIVAGPSGERQSLNGYQRGDQDARRRFSCHLERHRAQQPDRLSALVDARAHYRTRDDEGIPGVTRADIHRFFILYELEAPALKFRPPSLRRRWMQKLGPGVRSAQPEM